jgi:uncharacterized membrane protein YwzB
MPKDNVKVDRKLSSDYYFWSIQSLLWDPFHQKKSGISRRYLFLFVSLKLGMHGTKNTSGIINDDFFLLNLSFKQKRIIECGVI